MVYILFTMQYSAQKSEMYELLNYFMQSTKIEIEPKSTRIFRAVLLRILYSCLHVTVPECVCLLEEHGVLIGKYNANDTMQGLMQGLTTMQISAWVHLLSYLDFGSTASVFKSLEEEYGEQINESPLWQLKTVFEVFF